MDYQYNTISQNVLWSFALVNRLKTLRQDQSLCTGNPNTIPPMLSITKQDPTHPNSLFTPISDFLTPEVSIGKHGLEAKPIGSTLASIKASIWICKAGKKPPSPAHHPRVYP